MDIYKFLAFSLFLHMLLFIDITAPFEKKTLETKPSVLIKFKKNKLGARKFPNKNIKKATPSKKPNKTRQSKNHKEEITSYRQALIQYIQSNATYPPAAKALKQEGTVILTLTINSQGDFIAQKVSRGSGHSSLNRASTQLIKKLKSFKALPEKVSAPLNLSIPVHYIIK